MKVDLLYCVNLVGRFSPHKNFASLQKITKGVKTEEMFLAQ